MVERHLIYCTPVTKGVLCFYVFLMTKMSLCVFDVQGGEGEAQMASYLAPCFPEPLTAPLGWCSGVRHLLQELLPLHDVASHISIF